MQKILYIAHMIYLDLDENKDDPQPLIDEKFQAWRLGPVAPRLYHHIKSFGDRKISTGAFFTIFPNVKPESEEYKVLEFTYDMLKDKSVQELIGITHWQNGAWAKSYVNNSRGNTIPNKLILQEIHDRQTTT